MLRLTPFPHLLFLVDDLGENRIGQANAFVIRIEKEHNKESVYAHELEHVKQWYLTLGVHPLLYLVSKRYRQWSEVQAFKQSIKHGRELESAARALSKYYNLDITYEQAEALLKG